MNIIKLKEMDIEWFAKVNNLQITVQEREPTIYARYKAEIDNAEEKDDTILRSVYGYGETITDAVNNLCEKLSFKLLIINAMTPERREIRVPKLTYGGYNGD